MLTPFDFTRQLAARCAAIEACITTELTAAALSCSPEAARSTLKLAAEAGYFRPTVLSGLGNKIVFQPTPKAAGWRGTNVPKFLRAGLSDEARWRGLLRAHVALVTHPELTFLSAQEQSELCREVGIQERGHARALAARMGDTLQLFIPVLATDSPASVVMAAASRWLLLLETAPTQLPLPEVLSPLPATLHFIAQAGESAAKIAEVLTELNPSDGRVAASELADLDRQISSDKSGLLALKLASRRAELAALASFPSQFPWLGSLIVVAL